MSILHNPDSGNSHSRDYVNHVIDTAVPRFKNPPLSMENDPRAPGVSADMQLRSQGS